MIFNYFKFESLILFFEYLLLVYGVLILAAIPWLSILNYSTDPSYGIYLYSWPIQQLSAQLFDLTSFQSLVLIIPIILLGFLSYKFIERPLIASSDLIFEKLGITKNNNRQLQS
jgi:peptidoglycan/LPS O-acetylase OafA/YrhL